jgi:cyclohexanone monooxygenase
MGRHGDMVVTKESKDTFDVIVIGAGFAGMYALHRLRDQMGLSVKVFERGNDVGGTWYWNRYPGARCDVRSVFYSYSFSPELEQEWEWTELFPAQPEILRYAQHVADRFDLRRDIAFNTAISAATFDESSNDWTVDYSDGLQVHSRFLIAAVGCLSESRIPDIPGIESFAGEIYHTGRWPHEEVDFTGKRVAVIGTGSSGIQVIPRLAEQAAELTVLQRTPAFSLPARNRSLGSDELKEVKAEYPKLRAECRVSPAGTTRVPPIGSAFDTPREIREREFWRRWNDGGVSFLSTFTDTSSSLLANNLSADFVRERIRETVIDPGTAERLTPRDYPIGAKRICLDTDYFETYNRENVRLISLRETPIDEFVPTGVRLGADMLEIDAVVFATGYDAMTGPLNAIDIRGLGGRMLRDEWAGGPQTFLGVASAGFPNLFMITGPGSPSVLVNMFVAIEQHVDWITDFIHYARSHRIARAEAELAAQDRWMEHVADVASHTLFPQAASWYVGANIPGKARVFMLYAGGIKAYREKCDDVAATGYSGFALSADSLESAEHALEGGRGR